MIDNVFYKRSVSECVKMDYLQQQKIKYKFWPHTPLSSVRSYPPFKNSGYATVVPCTQNEKSAPLDLCVVSLCVYTVGCILWVLQKCMVTCSLVVQVKSCLVLTKSFGLGLGLGTRSLGLGLGLDKKVLFTSLPISQLHMYVMHLIPTLSFLVPLHRRVYL